MSNDFLPFAIGGSANVESQSNYLTDPVVTNGQAFGSTGSSSLNNKALRQATVPASQIAQFMANQTGTSISDNGVTAQFLAQLAATFQYLNPVINRYTSSTGNWNATYYFFIASGNATQSATYTNNGVTYTVVATVAAATLVQMSGNGTPLTSGTLTKTGGTGDATITFYAMRAPLNIEIDVVGDGGGGAATTTNAGSAGSGTTFGGTLLQAGAGNGGATGNNGGGTGGTPTVNSPAVAIISLIGGEGGCGSVNGFGIGASGPFGGSGANVVGGTGSAGVANSGSGGGAAISSSGGGAGAYIKALITSPLSTYAYSIGSGGAAGAAGGAAGGAGGSGVVVVKASYQ